MFFTWNKFCFLPFLFNLSLSMKFFVSKLFLPKEPIVSPKLNFPFIYLKSYNKTIGELCLMMHTRLFLIILIWTSHNIISWPRYLVTCCILSRLAYFLRNRRVFFFILSHLVAWEVETQNIKRTCGIFRGIKRKE